MTVYYIDTLGEVAVDVDHNCIQFIGGECYFSSGYEEYRIPITALIEICD